MSRLFPRASEPEPDRSEAPNPERDGQLSRMFLRGFEAGQKLSAREFDVVLPSLLEQFVSGRGDDGEADADAARRWAERFLRFAQRRRQLAISTTTTPIGV